MQLAFHSNIPGTVMENGVTILYRILILQFCHQKTGRWGKP